MSRPAKPRDQIVARYEAGPPKRIVLSIFRVGRGRETLSISTADARAFGANLWRSIDTAEADKIALRGVAKVALPKRARPKAGAAKAPPRPSRLKRVEQSALNLYGALDQIGRERLPPEARALLAELADALNLKPITEGLSR